MQADDEPEDEVLQSCDSEEETRDGEVWSENEEEDEESRPEDEFFQLLLGLLLQKHVTPEQFCNLVFFATKAGDDLKKLDKYGKRPGLTKGCYGKHLKKNLSMYADAKPAYDLELPVQKRDSPGRATMNFKVLQPQEEIQDELDKIEGWQEQLKQAIDEDKFPKAYNDHPVVKKNEGTGKLVLPIAMFVDGVPFAREDSVIGIWIINMLTQRRHFIIALRKSLLCKCGCKGWCTYWEIWNYVNHCFEAMAEGKFIEKRHDNQDWKFNDKHRKELAAKLTIICAVLYIKGDWVEYSISLGMPTHNETSRPCFGCNCNKQNMHEVADLGPTQEVHRANKEEDYFQAVARCEIEVEILNVNMRNKIWQTLHFYKDRNHPRGFALKEDLPRYNLRKDDRLEPSEHLRNIGNFRTIEGFPKKVIFWRKSLDTISRRRNPIWNLQTGVTPARSLTSDLLHAMNLGVIKGFNGITLWVLLKAEVWGTGQSHDESLNNQVAIISNQIKAWYKYYHLDHPKENLTRIGKFTTGRIGTRANPKCDSKAAEAWGIFKYLLQSLEINKDNSKIAAGLAYKLLTAGRALEKCNSIWYSTERTQLTTEEMKTAWDEYTLFLTITKDMEALNIPKKHVIVHVLQRMKDLGNPRKYANWLDESLNYDLKTACRKTTRFEQFEENLYCRMRQWLQRVAEGR